MKNSENGLQNPFGIDYEIFNKEDQRTEDLHLQLSEKYMVYKDLADRCIINPTQIDKGDHRVFYIKPDTVFMQEPRIQNQFRNEFIKHVSAPPIPEPFTLLADDIYKQMLDDIRDQSSPHIVRDKLNQFFQRRQFKLQHKRHKYLSRWSHFALTSELVDKVSLNFSPNFSKIQFELEQAIKRYQRLDGEDHFDSKARPQRIEPNGLINPEDLNVDEKEKKHCSLRVDDIDIFTRIVSYESACNKPVEKFINRAKWVPLAHRFDVYKQSQERMQNMKNLSIENQRAWSRRIETKGMSLIERYKMGERGFKELQQIKSSLQFVKQEKKIRNQRDSYIQTASYNHELPPLIIWNQIELKLSLEDLCKDFSITGDMEIDDGNSFSYVVVVAFPAIFYNQVVKTQFAPYDALPQPLNPADIGRRDIQQVLEDNIRKYGKGPPGSNLIEQLEIEKHSQSLNIQYINQIEKALFGEFNNGQVDDFPKVRLRKSHWLPYICFKAELSKEQMQQASLLSCEQNPIDQVTAHLLEIININDVSNVNLTLESLSQIHYDKLRSGKVRSEIQNLDRSDSDSIFSENQKAFLISYMDCIKVKSDYGQKLRGMQDEDIQKNSLYDTTQHLLFAEYLMVCLKSREQKTKLLYTLNAFRSLQKRIALELRELSTRDRVSLDVTIVVPKEKQDTGLFTTKAGEEKTHGKRGEPQLNVENVVMDELIDINRYRIDGLTQKNMWSTCPVLPKFHVTFGEPIERQEVSTEFEVNKNQDPRKEQSQRLLGRIDFISEHEQSGCVLVADDYGVNLMYDATFADMRALEQELIRVMSYYINKLEPMTDTDFRNVYPVVDRFNMVREIIICEEKYQRAKLNLAFQYLDCYEHTCDTLEQQRIVQIIVDLMAKRPRLNLAANHFKESYTVEIQVLETQTKLVKEFIKMQMDNEINQNSIVRESLEKTYRLIYEQNDNKWQYYEKQDLKDEKEKRQINAVGLKNGAADMQKMKKLENAKPGMFNAKLPAVNINQFAEMLGMPISSLKMLLKEHTERDPHVKQSIHEHTSFIKLQEGYPIFFTHTEISKSNKVQLVPGSQLIGMLEIYESLSQITKLVAASHHAITELYDTHQPDNGLVSSFQSLVTMEFLLAELRAVKAEMRGDQVMQSRDLEVIDDSSILGNPEKMLFFIKELIAAAEDPNLIQNPFVLTKIDMETIKSFDFDTVQSKKFRKKGAELLSASKDAVATEETISEDDDEDADDFAKKQKLHERNKDKGYPRLKIKITRPNIPSMLEVYCNCVEVLRLRSVLVEAYHQRTSLIRIYTQQCQLMGKENKVFFKDALNFETHLSGGNNWKNFVDTGPGMETFVKTELSVKEFDPSLTAVLNFSDPEAFKALVCPLGLEELRAVVRYELLNLHIMIVAVRHNQILLDNCERQLSEIELFEKGYLVSAPACDILTKLYGQNLFESNLKRLPDTERRKITNRITDKVSKCTFSVLAKKTRPKDTVENSYKKIRQAVIDQKFEKVEIGLRYLRTSRILLCHDFCSDVQSEIYVQSVRMELLNEVNHIRRRAYLLPRDAMVHKLPLPKYGEHTFAAYSEESYRNEQEEQFSEWVFYDDKKGRITDFLKLPDNYEVCTVRSELEEFQKANFSQKLYVYNLESHFTEEQRKHNQLPLLLDMNQKQLIKNQLPVLNLLDQANSDTTLTTRGRYVDFKQAPTINNLLLFKYLYYFRQLQNLFDLQYFGQKLATRANSISTLEQCVMSGAPFWEVTQDPTQVNEDIGVQNDDNQPIPNYSQRPNDFQFRNKLAEKVVMKMTQEKKLRVQLNTELDSLKQKFQGWAEKMMKQQLQGDLVAAGDFLSEQVQLGFYNTLLALYTVRETKIKEGEAQKEILSINELLSIFSHIDDTKVTYSNGYHVNHATTCMSRISLDDNVHRPDYTNFFLASLPIIDEQGLNPTEFNLIRGMYTANSSLHKCYRKLKPHIGWLPNRDFNYLDMKLLNVQHDLRKYISTNIRQCADQQLEYAHAKLKVEVHNYQHSFNNQKEVFNEMKQFSRHQIKSHKLKNVLMILMTKSMLPNNIKEMNKLWFEFNELFQWKVSDKADEIVRHRNAGHSLSAPKTGVKSIQQEIAQPRKREIVSQIVSQFDIYSCEIDVYQREIQKFMILTSKRLIERETTSLAKVFEINGKRMEVLIGVHQQFAATLDTAEDKRGHLDITNKVAPVQKMLTQMKNRMLSIKTLTGGEGIIIRSKDLTTIIEELCRGIVKYDQHEFNTRCEYLASMIDNYENLLYAKDQQIYTMEHKLQHAKDELNKIVNVKVFSKGNTLIYELDHSLRQLRLIKDNIYTMEGKLKDSIRLEFDKDLERARLELVETRKKFAEYQNTLNSHVKAEIKDNINSLDVELKRLINQQQKPAIEPAEKPGPQLIDEYSHLLGGEAKRQYKEAQHLGKQQFPPGSVLNSADLVNLLREFELLKASENEARQEVLEMQNLMRKQRMLQNFKWLIAQRKWDQKVDNLKQQLSSNATLWEQLAESEKRERVLKQELESLQIQTQTQVRIIDRFKDDMRTITIQNKKLTDYISDNDKKLKHFQSRTKDLDLYQDINIPKIIQVVESKQNRINELERLEKIKFANLDKTLRQMQTQVKVSQERTKEESKVKEEAINLLNELRQKEEISVKDPIGSVGFWQIQYKTSQDKVEMLQQEIQNYQEFLSEENLLNRTEKPLTLSSKEKRMQFSTDFSEIASNRPIGSLTKLPSLMHQPSARMIQNSKSVLSYQPDNQTARIKQKSYLETQFMTDKKIHKHPIFESQPKGLITSERHQIPKVKIRQQLHLTKPSSNFQNPYEHGQKDLPSVKKTKSVNVFSDLISNTDVDC